MKRILLLLCTFIVLPSHVMSQSGVGVGTGGGIGPGRPDPKTWERYTVKGEEFSVILPMLPAMITVKAPEKPQQKQRRQRQLLTTLGGVVYEINIFDNPEPSQSLEDFISEQIGKSVYDVTTERNLTINGFVGKEYSSRNKTSVSTVQFFAMEGRLFRFSTVAPLGDNPGVKQFFSSIRLGKDQDGIEVSEGSGRPFYVDGERIYTGREIDVKARLLAKPEPTYTEKARREGISGVVVLRTVFSATGEVTNIRVVSGLPHGLTEQAIKSAKKIKFTPAMKDGKPVSMWMQLEYNFHF